MDIIYLTVAAAFWVAAIALALGCERLHQRKAAP